MIKYYSKKNKNNYNLKILYNIFKLILQQKYYKKKITSKINYK